MNKHGCHLLHDCYENGSVYMRHLEQCPVLSKWCYLWSLPNKNEYVDGVVYVRSCIQGPCPLAISCPWEDLPLEPARNILVGVSQAIFRASVFDVFTQCRAFQQMGTCWVRLTHSLLCLLQPKCCLWANIGVYTDHVCEPHVHV